MPFPMKIQPINSPVSEDWTKAELIKPPAVKSRLKRLLERQFSSVLRNSAADKTAAGGGSGGEEVNSCFKDGFNGSNDFEPSSACLAKMVQSFIEENPEKQSSVSVRCGRNRCNCFNRICDDSSGEESDSCESNCSRSEASEILKGLASCTSVCERNLLADTAKILEKNKICKHKDGFCRQIVTDELINLGYDASICKSRWEKSSYYPAGEYEYIDVVIGRERLIIDVDFRSEFEIARSTKAYKAILQNLPNVFVGKCDRLQRIVAVMSEAGKQSLKKKGMHVPPWRRAEYVRAKWLSPYTRIGSKEENMEKHDEILKEPKEGNSEDLIFGLCENSGEEENNNKEDVNVVGIQLKKPPEMKPKGSLSGLAAVFDDDNP